MEECISVFDMLKIGVGPSSSHTLGPWRAAERFLKELKDNNSFQNTHRIQVDLYGSLSLTGKGHATDLAIMLGLSGQDPEYIPIENISKITKSIIENDQIILGNEVNIPFKLNQDIKIYFQSVVNEQPNTIQPRNGYFCFDLISVFFLKVLLALFFFKFSHTPCM